MEYYEGYLVPVGSSPADVPPHHNRPAALSRENEYLRARVKKLQKTIKKMTTPSHRKHNPSKENPRYSPNNYRISRREQQDMEEENHRLREENKVLNEYFDVFSKKYEEDREELRERGGRFGGGRSVGGSSYVTEGRWEQSCGGGRCGGSRQDVGEKSKSKSKSKSTTKYNLTRVRKYLEEGADGWTRASDTDKRPAARPR